MYIIMYTRTAVPDLFVLDVHNYALQPFGNRMLYLHTVHTQLRTYKYIHRPDITIISHYMTRWTCIQKVGHGLCTIPAKRLSANLSSSELFPTPATCIERGGRKERGGGKG